MSWGAVDDRFHQHRKVMRLRRSPHYAAAVALWTLSLSWCCAQEQERFTGVIPFDVLASFGVPDWYDAAELLIESALWERAGEDAAGFHDWTEWNGIAGKELRSKEQARLRQQAKRAKDCQAGSHSRHCPTEVDGKPWVCPRRAARQTRHGGSRDPGPGRAGPGREHHAEKQQQKEETHDRRQPSPSAPPPGNRSGSESSPRPAAVEW